MTSERRSDDPNTESRNLSERLQKIATQKPPAPPGRGIVTVVLGVLVAVAIIWQLFGGGGPAAAIRENHPRQPLAPEGGAERVTPQPPRASEAPVRPPVEATGPALPVLAPGSDIQVPEAIDTRTAGALRLSLNAFRPGLADMLEEHEIALMRADALRQLAAIVDGASESNRAQVRAFVLQQLAPLVQNPALGSAVLDTALEVMGAHAAYADDVITAALFTGLGQDRVAASAMVFLDAVRPSLRGGANGGLESLVRDPGRPLHLRVLALERLADWGAVSAPLAEWARLPERPAALREALD